MSRIETLSVHPTWQNVRVWAGGVVRGSVMTVVPVPSCRVHSTSSIQNAGFRNNYTAYLNAGSSAILKTANDKTVHPGCLVLLTLCWWQQQQEERRPQWKPTASGQPGVTIYKSVLWHGMAAIRGSNAIITKMPKEEGRRRHVDGCIKRDVNIK